MTPPQTGPRDPQLITVTTRRGPVQLNVHHIASVTDTMEHPAEFGFVPRAVISYRLQQHKGAVEVMQLVVSDVAANVVASIKQLTDGLAVDEAVPPIGDQDAPSE